MRAGKSIGIVLLTTMSLLLSACGTSVPDMTEEESAQVVEYAAGLLLKYDTNHHSRLVEVDIEQEIKATDEIEKEAEGTQEVVENTEVIDEEESSLPEEISENHNNDVAKVVEKSRSIEEFYGVSGVEIKYTGFEIKDVYPESGADEFVLSMIASKGCKLIVLNFEMRNVTQQDIKVDMISVDTRFKISFNNEAPRYALTTMLPDDLASYIGTIAVGDSQNLVLMAEIPEEEVDSIQSVSLVMKNVSEGEEALMN